MKLKAQPERREATTPPTRRVTSPSRLALLVGLIGLLITVSVTGVAWTLNRHSEHRLLELQTRQAGAVLGATILGIGDPLATAVQIEVATGGDVGQFDRWMAAYTGPGRLFVSASAWEVGATTIKPIASVGVTPDLPPASGAAHAFVTRALQSATFVVTSVRAGNVQRIGYASADPQAPRFVVYAERAIPANRQVSVESNPAFADLDYATYLGPTTALSSLATTDVPLSQLPLSGDTARETIPFGDTVLTLVTTPRGHLGGALGAELPWIFLIGGALLTIATALIAVRLATHRRAAERDADTIAGLYGRLEGLYGEQRTIAEALQRALLPPFNPSIPGLDAASEYVAGAAGVDIGGDWYSLVALDPTHFAFVVGDVSGRGVSAAAIMARLRFTIRAYLLEGHAPDVVLTMCSNQLDLQADGHFATVFVGRGDLETRELTVSNAGHPRPLIITGSTADYADVTAEIPLGLAPHVYTSRKVALPDDAIFLAFTDGLVERRGEDIDAGFARLAAAATTSHANLEGLLAAIFAQVAHEGTEDDIAVLAFRWRPAERIRSV